jgi:hypothetical protein
VHLSAVRSLCCLVSTHCVDLITCFTLPVVYTSVPSVLSHTCLPLRPCCVFINEVVFTARYELNLLNTIQVNTSVLGVIARRLIICILHASYVK